MLAQASQTNYEQAKQQVGNLGAQIQSRENQLSATDAASQQARLQQAESQLPAARAQLTAAIAREDALQGNFDSTNENTNGLLIRLQALNELSGGDFTLNAARFLLFLLFLVIECLPVTVKLLQRPGNYEKILAAAAKRELNAARRAVREDRIFPLQDTDSEYTTPSAAGDSARDAVDAEIDNIWQHDGSTKFMPMDGWRGAAPTDELNQPGDDAGEPSPYEEALQSRVSDTRDMSAATDSGTNGYRRRQGGIERHYDADDL